jgi:hypothetical protein
VLLTVVRLPLALVLLAEGPVLVVDNLLVALDLTHSVALALADGVTSLLVALAPFIIGALAPLAMTALLVTIVVIRVMTFGFRTRFVFMFAHVCLFYKHGNFFFEFFIFLYYLFIFF